MIFSSFEFILLFFPIVYVVYIVLNKSHWNVLAKIWLVLASLYFYAQGSKDFFPFFLGSIFGNYIVGSSLGKMNLNNKSNPQKKVLLLVGVLANVGLLGYYKYTDFFIENYNYITGYEVPLRYIVLPIGISFFTFQLIAFLVDSYRGECDDYDVLNYLLFITFFPQLIVGPIVHHSDIIPQFNDEKTAKINFDNIQKGLFLFVVGCAKKILLADVLTTNAQAYFDNVSDTFALNVVEVWFHSIEYTISYYFDLSSYADMAIGLGLMFNLIIPHNFNSPYKARNFQDYWRRWHMTLSRFLGDYIFRNVYRKGDKWRNFYVATMITFLVSGFWHGAGWTFVIWGIINGLLVCVASWMKRHDVRLPDLLAYTLTGLGIIWTRVLFISPTFSYAWNVYKGMCGFNGVQNVFERFMNIITEDKTVTFTLIIAIFICWFLPNSKEMVDKFRPTVVTLIYVIVLFALCCINMNHASSFLYFQF